MATRTQNVLGEKGRRIRELTVSKLQAKVGANMLPDIKPYNGVTFHFNF